VNGTLADRHLWSYCGCHGQQQGQELADDLIAELPEASPAAGPSLSAPEPDLRKAINGAPGRFDTMIGKTYDLLDQLRRNGW